MQNFGGMESVEITCYSFMKLEVIPNLYFQLTICLFIMVTVPGQVHKENRWVRVLTKMSVTLDNVSNYGNVFKSTYVLLLLH